MTLPFSKRTIQPFGEIPAPSWSISTSVADPPSDDPADPTDYVQTHPIEDHSLSQVWKNLIDGVTGIVECEFEGAWANIALRRRGWNHLLEPSVVISLHWNVNDQQKHKKWLAAIHQISHMCTEASGVPVQAEFEFAESVDATGYPGVTFRHQQLYASGKADMTYSVTTSELELERGVKSVTSHIDTHTIIQFWEAVRPRVLQIVRTAFTRFVASVDVLRRGDGVIMEATVVISLREDYYDLHPRWVEALHEISDLCSETCEQKVHAEFTFSGVSRQGIGETVGLRGKKKKAGSIGGYIVLKMKDDRQVTALMTCHHVLTKHREPALPSILEKEPRVVVSPSDSQYKADIADFRREILQTRQNYNGPSSGEEFDRHRDTIDHLELMLDLHLSQKRKIGTLMGSSGIRGCTGGRFSHDWALVKLQSLTTAFNSLLFPATPPDPAGFAQVSDFGSIEYGHLCQKFDGNGHVSSQGICNAILSDVFWPDIPSVQPIREICIVNNNNNDNNKSGPFSREGDSGLWIFQGRYAVGMLFAANDAGWSYVAPMNSILDDIKSTFDCEISLVKVQEDEVDDIWI